MNGHTDVTAPQQAATAVSELLNYLHTHMHDAGLPAASAVAWCYRRSTDMDSVRVLDDGRQLQWEESVEFYGFARYQAATANTTAEAWSLFPECGPTLPGLAFPTGAHQVITDAVQPYIAQIAGLGLGWRSCAWVFPTGVAVAYDTHTVDPHARWRPTFRLKNAQQILTPDGQVHSLAH